MQAITDKTSTTHQYIIDNTPQEYLAEIVIALCILGIIWYTTGTRRRINSRSNW